MFSTYTNSIFDALIAFPFVALVFTLPYMIYCYRKYGELILLRVAIVYSFILYLLCAYFLIILPLPDYEEVMVLTTPRAQLIPFTSIKDIFKEAKEASNILRNRAFIQASFNILLTVPFGMYLRYYFNFSFKKTILCSFFLSLFFELTQLSGLYFIYPRGYRLFDVDDLFFNTLGGLIGYYLTTPILRVLPTRQKIDEDSLKKSLQISFMRRFLLIFIDITMITILSSLIQSILDAFDLGIIINYSISALIYLIFIPILLRSRTIGMIATRVEIQNENNEKAKPLSIVLRYVILIGLYLIVPSLLVNLFQYLENVEIINKTIRIVFIMIILGFWLILYLYTFIKLLKKKTLFF